MNQQGMENCNFEDPASVVAAFIEAMNQWEIESWKASRDARDTADPASYQAAVLQNMNQVFATYCTDKDRKQGRSGSFQKPPEYDPATERTLSTSLEDDGKRAIVETERQAILGGGRYRYVLHRKGNQWRIDNLKYEYDGKWQQAIL